MNITFNDIVDIPRLYNYTGMVYSYNTYPATEFDYFSDTAVTGDAVYFGNSINRIGGELNINVSVPLVATSISVVWEYLSRTGTRTELTNVVDGSNAFQNSGACQITFDVPIDWIVANLGIRGYYIRCRIDSVSGLTEGGRNTSTKPTIASYTIWLKEGGTDGVVRLSDILAADVAGGWGVVHNIGNLYQLDTGFIVGDQRSHLATPTNVVVLKILYETLELGSYTQKAQYLVNKDCTFQLGEYNSTTDVISSQSIFYLHNTMNGGSYSTYNIMGGSHLLYGSTYIKDAGGFYDPVIAGYVEIKDSIISSKGGGTFYFSGLSSTSSMDRVSISCSGSYWYLYANISLNDINLANTTGLLSTSPITVSNTNFKTKKLYNGGSGTITANNCKMDNYETQTTTLANVNSKIYFTNDIDFYIYDEDGNALSDVNLEIIDATGTTVYDNVYTTTINILSYTKINQTGSYRTPFTITATKTGYETYYESEIEVKEKRDVNITLKKAIPLMITPDGNGYIKANKENLGNNREILL